jgi:hypothetical protein
MPKLDPTGTKTNQLGFANLQSFRVFSGQLSVGVSVRLALITCLWRIDTRADITGKSRREREMPLPF